MSLVFYIGMSAYIVSGIIYLVLDVDVCSDYSMLWIYSLSSLLLSLVAATGPSIFGMEDSDSFEAEKMEALKEESFFVQNGGASPPQTYLYLMAAIAWSIFGAVVLFGGYVCSTMYLEGLYVWSLVTLSAQFFSIVALVAYAIFFIPPYQTFSSNFDKKRPRPADEESGLLHP